MQETKNTPEIDTQRRDALKRAELVSGNEELLPTVAPEPTLGESRVRVKFNVVESSAERKNVDSIKYESAKLIDFCEDGKKDVAAKQWNDKSKGEANRLWSLAQTAYEEAAMYAVKAATFGL